MSFSDQIKAFTSKVELNMANAVTNIVSDVADELIFRTPVDTGRARANWTLGVDSLPSKFFKNSFDPEGDATSNKIRSLIPINPIGHSYFIANNTPYILELENGKSKQAPTGMVRLTQLRFKHIIGNSNHVVR